MKNAWWKEADEDAQVDELTRSALERVIDQKGKEARERVEREKARAKEAAKQRPGRIQKMRPISYYADMLGYAPDTIRGWIAAGELKADYIRGAYRISDEEIQRFIEKENRKRGTH